MEKLIEYRKLLDKLNDNEYELFLSKLLPMISNKENMSTILFHHFKELHSKNEYTQVQNVNDILSEILNDRKKSSPEPNTNDTIVKDLVNKEESEPICFDDVPNELISEIISFSSFKEYLNYQKINRRTFIICKSPIKFAQLSSRFCIERGDSCFTSYLSKYLEDCCSNQPITNYFNFTNIKSLCIDLDHLDYFGHWSSLNNNNINVFEFIQHLQIDCSGTKNVDRWYKLQRLFKNNKIKTLSLTNDVNAEITPNILCILIPHFPYLESLQIGQLDQQNDIDISSWSDEDILSLFSNLKILSLFKDGSIITDRIVKVIGKQLEHVTICDMTAFSKHGWHNLIELNLVDTSQTVVDNITKTATNIQKMSIDLNTNNALYPIQKNVKLAKLIKQQKKLKYLSIDCGGNALNEVVISLLSSLTVNPLKIRLDLGWRKELDDSLMFQCVKDVINALKVGTKNNFLLIICSTFKLPEIERFSMNESVGRLDHFDKKYYLMIKSNQYQMYGGYIETWMNYPNYFLH